MYTLWPPFPGEFSFPAVCGSLVSLVIEQCVVMQASLSPCLLGFDVLRFRLSKCVSGFAALCFFSCPGPELLVI